MKISTTEYTANTAYDELISKNLLPRDIAKPFLDYFASMDGDELAARMQAVDSAILAMGITFTIYSDAGNIDRAWPFDIVPRIISSTEWDFVQKGLKQRLTAMNMFINDLYNDQNIVRDGVFPLKCWVGQKTSLNNVSA